MLLQMTATLVIDRGRFVATEAAKSSVFLNVDLNPHEREYRPFIGSGNIFFTIPCCKIPSTGAADDIISCKFYTHVQKRSAKPPVVV